MLRRSPSQIAIVRYEGFQPTEIWSGDIETSLDFDRLMCKLNVPRVIADQV